MQRTIHERGHRYIYLAMIFICIAVLRCVGVSAADTQALKGVSISKEVKKDTSKKSSKEIYSQLQLVEAQLKQLKKMIAKQEELRNREALIFQTSPALPRYYLAEFGHYLSKRLGDIRGSFFAWKAVKLPDVHTLPRSLSDLVPIIVHFFLEIGVSLLLYVGSTHLRRKAMRSMLSYASHRPFFKTALSIASLILPVLFAHIAYTALLFTIELNGSYIHGMMTVSTGIASWIITSRIHRGIALYLQVDGVFYAIFTACFKVLERLIILFVVANLAFLFANTLEVPYAGQRLIWDALSIGFCAILLTFIHTVKRPVFKILSRKAVARYLWGPSFKWVWSEALSIFLFLGLVVWIIDEPLFYSIFPPIFTTLFCIVMIPIAIRLIRLLRVFYLWRYRHRHHGILWLSVLRSNLWSNRVIKGIVYFGTFGIFLRIWDADLSPWFTRWVRSSFIEKLFNVVLLIFFAKVTVKICTRFMEYYWMRWRRDHQEMDEIHEENRIRTLMAVGKIVLRIMVWVPTTLLALRDAGYDIGPLLTGFAFLLAGLGFASQHFIRDFLAGFFILLENTLAVGDHVTVDGRSGSVEGITLRAVRIRSDESGALYTIPFGLIQVIGNKSRVFTYVVVNVTVAYQEDLQKIQKLMEKAASQVKRGIDTRNKVLEFKIVGVMDVSDYAVVVQGKFKTVATYECIVKAQFTAILKTLFDEAGIILPKPPYSVGEKRIPSLINAYIPS